MKGIQRSLLSFFSTNVKYVRPVIKTWRQMELEKEKNLKNELLPNEKTDRIQGNAIDASILENIILDPDTMKIPTGILKAIKDDPIDLEERSIVMTEHVNEKILWLANNKRYKEAIDLLNEMTRKYNVKPNSQTLEVASFIHSKLGSYKEAIRMLKFQNEPYGHIAQQVFFEAITDYIKRDNATSILRVYDILRGKTIPEPIISQHVIRFLGKKDETEKAFKIYRELKAQGMLANYAVMQSMLYAFSRRKEYFNRALEIFRQMQVLKMPVTVHEYNNLLYGCGKVADLQTGLMLWNQFNSTIDSNNEKKEGIKPNSISYSSILWVLASVETKNDKISKRSFSYDLNVIKLAESAHKIYNEAIERGFVNHGAMITAYLAVFANHLLREETERIFNNEFQRFNVPRAPLAYEIMFKLYDSTRCYDAMIKLKDQMHMENIKLTYEGWRAIIRTAALCDKLKEAIQFIREMIDNGFEPRSYALKVLKLRLIERSEWKLKEQFDELVPEMKSADESKSFALRKRTIVINTFLKKQYGLNAPKLATK